MTADTPLLMACDITRLKWALKISWAANTSSWLTFDIQISDDAGGRRAVRTHIMRALLTDSSKKMDANRAYMDFARVLGAKVSAADPSAQVSLREGKMPAGFDLGSLEQRVSPPGVAR